MAPTQKQTAPKPNQEYLNDNIILDNQLGPLELALEQSNRQIEQERAVSLEQTIEPASDAPVSTCEYCHHDFPSSNWYLDVHVPRCEKEHAQNKGALLEGLECPICKIVVSGSALLAHLQRSGPLECREHWRALNVVEKKTVHPVFDLARFDLKPKPSPPVQAPALEPRTANPNPFAMPPDTRSLPDKPAFCPHCGTSVIREDWFLDLHLGPCEKKATEGGTLNIFNSKTGLRGLVAKNDHEFRTVRRLARQSQENLDEQENAALTKGEDVDRVDEVMEPDDEVMETDEMIENKFEKMKKRVEVIGKKLEGLKKHVEGMKRERNAT